MTAAASVGRRDHHPQARLRPDVRGATATDVEALNTGGIVTAARPGQVPFARMESGIQVEPDDAGAISDAAGGSDIDALSAADRPLRILVLADRDWTHPQGGGTGANVYENIVRWALWGHQVTLVAGEYPGCAPVEMVTPNLVVHRMGGRGSVFPRAAWAVLRGLGADADVVFEVINGITFLTPLWLRKPRVALVNHPHRALYMGEFGTRLGRLLCAALEELPLRLLYRRVPFLTISDSARQELVALDGVPEQNITIAYCGVGPGPYGPGERAPEPRLLYVGRLKAYKRIEVLLDMLTELPDATLDIAGHGDHGETLDDEIARRGLGDRVRVHGYVDEQTKADLYRQAWLHVTASMSEGWSLTVMEAALCGTPSAAVAIGGLRESIVDGETGILARDPADLRRRVGELLQDHELRARLGAAALARAETFTWERTATTTLAVVQRHVATAAQQRRGRRRPAGA
jgi:glycosyltransferase involved in cell wall biosynthesis